MKKRTAGGDSESRRKKKSGMASRNKGKRGERELAKFLSSLLPKAECSRGAQHSGKEGRDVVGISGLHIECKRCERPQLPRAYEQAVRDAHATDTPTVFTRQNQSEWMFYCAAADLPEVARIILQYCDDA